MDPGPAHGMGMGIGTGKCKQATGSTQLPIGQYSTYISQVEIKSEKNVQRRKNIIVFGTVHTPKMKVNLFTPTIRQIITEQIVIYGKTLLLLMVMLSCVHILILTLDLMRCRVWVREVLGP